MYTHWTCGVHTYVNDYFAQKNSNKIQSQVLSHRKWWGWSRTCIAIDNIYFITFFTEYTDTFDDDNCFVLPGNIDSWATRSKGDWFKSMDFIEVSRLDRTQKRNFITNSAQFDFFGQRFQMKLLWNICSRPPRSSFSCGFNLRFVGMVTSILAVPWNWLFSWIHLSSVADQCIYNGTVRVQWTVNSNECLAKFFE